MKLNKRGVHWLIRQKRKGVTSKELAATMKLSRRRIEQIWKYYRDAGQKPLVGIRMTPPPKPFDLYEFELVKYAYRRYKLGAQMLEVLIGKVYKVRISHNRIHMYLQAADKGLPKAWHLYTQFLLYGMGKGRRSQPAAAHPIDLVDLKR